MIDAPISLSAAREEHILRLVNRDADEGGLVLHASDHGGCDYATHLRLLGTPRLPYTASTLANFERGLAYEHPFFDAISQYAKKLGFETEIAPPIEGDIAGHPDILLYEDGHLIAVIDPSTTASSSTAWKYSHAIKSAAYAVDMGCDLFCEWVHRFAWIGEKGGPRAYGIIESQEHWFSLDDIPKLQTLPPGVHRASTWRELVAASIERIRALRTTVPAQAPPIDPLSGEPETWRCRAYCEAQCSLNQRLPQSVEEIPL